MSLTLWSLWSQRFISLKPSCSMLFLHLAGSTRVLVLVSAAGNCQAAFSGGKQLANVAIHLHPLAWRLTWQKPWCAQYRSLSHNGQYNLSCRENLEYMFQKKDPVCPKWGFISIIKKAVWKIVLSHQWKRFCHGKGFGLSKTMQTWHLCWTRKLQYKFLFLTLFTFHSAKWRGIYCFQIVCPSVHPPIPLFVPIYTE